MPRFVILEHQFQGVHWDFMLESGETLRTWRLERPPESGRPIIAKPLADHRRTFLDYEGEISGGRGRVNRWDHGEFEWLINEPRSVEVRLDGGRLRGQAQLHCGETDDWIFQMTSEASPTGERDPGTVP
jgi:hypothetical protein